MESLTFEYRGGRALASPPAPVLVGVVCSGNLEVLVEPAASSGMSKLSTFSLPPNIRCSNKCAKPVRPRGSFFEPTR